MSLAHKWLLLAVINRSCCHLASSIFHPRVLGAETQRSAKENAIWFLLSILLEFRQRCKLMAIVFLCVPLRLRVSAVKNSGAKFCTPALAKSLPLIHENLHPDWRRRNNFSLWRQT